MRRHSNYQMKLHACQLRITVVRNIHMKFAVFFAVSSEKSDGRHINKVTVVTYIQFRKNG